MFDHYKQTLKYSYPILQFLFEVAEDSVPQQRVPPPHLHLLLLPV